MSATIMLRDTYDPVSLGTRRATNGVGDVPVEVVKETEQVEP